METGNAFGRVVGHFESSVVDEAGESGPARGRVANGGGERTLAADPGQRRIEEGLQVGQNRRRAALPGVPALGRTAPANVGLDGEQSGDSCLRFKFSPRGYPFNKKAGSILPGLRVREWVIFA